MHAWLIKRSKSNNDITEHESVVLEAILAHTGIVPVCLSKQYVTQTCCQYPQIVSGTEGCFASIAYFCQYCFVSVYCHTSFLASMRWCQYTAVCSHCSILIVLAVFHFSVAVSQAFGGCMPCRFAV
jgi:hypothetical protein